MVGIVVTGTQSSLVGWSSLANNDSVIVAPSGQVIDLVTDYTVGSLSSIDFHFSGYLVLKSLTIGGNNNMVIGEQGSLTLAGGSLRLGGAFSSNASYLVNYGTITVQSTAIFSSNSSEIYNAGTILSNNFAIVMNVAGSDDRLINDGSIIASGYACVSMGFFVSRVVNHGDIISQGLDADPDSYQVGISVRGQAMIVNTGLIEGEYAGIKLEDDTPGPTCDLYNSGTIRGRVYSFFGVQGFVGDDKIVNRGLMDGNVYTSLGNDLVDTRGGTVDGNVQLSSGNDTLNAIGATITGFVDGSIGSDTYWTDDSDLTIYESFQNGDVNQVFARCNFRLGDNINTLTLIGFSDFQGVGNALGNLVQGNAGDNRLSGLAGADTINGDVGDDLINGGSQSDSLTGDDGQDTLQGGIGDDVLQGLAGNDLLVGGVGIDTQSGGLGEDVFQFTGLGQSTAARANADLISDFKQGEDRIDLSGIDAISTNAASNDGFTFIGTAAFSSVAGQVRAVQNVGLTYVEADVDGNGTVDFTIRLAALLVLNASDFVL